MTPNIKNQPFLWILLTPSLIFLVIFLLIPFLYLLNLSLRDVEGTLEIFGAYSLTHYLEVFTSGVYVKTIGSTLWMALQTTVYTLLLAYPAAYLLVKVKNSKMRAFFYILLVSPLLTSVVIRTFAWIILLAQNGIINNALLDLSIIQSPLSMLWNMEAVIIAYVQVMLPFAVLPIATSLGEIQPNLRDASMSLGYGRIKTFFKVTLPLTIPGMISGSIIIFCLAAGSFITPLLVGGRMLPLLPLSIYQQIMQVFNLPLAAAMSITLLVLVLVVVGALGLILKRWETKMNG